MPYWPNPSALPVLEDARPSRAPLAFHRTLDGYTPTPLRPLPGLARRCGVAAVWLKDESARLAASAFRAPAV